MITMIKGDLIDLFLKGEFDAIVHGCNCMSTMGAGIAAQIAKKFPRAAQADSVFLQGVSPANRLGNYSFATYIIERQNRQVINAYTQYLPGKDARLYAIETVFFKICSEYRGRKVGIPQIGCGIGGLSWIFVKPIVEKFANQFDVNLTVVLYDKQDN